MAAQIRSIIPFEIRMRNVMGYLLLVRDAVDKGYEYHRPNEIPGDEAYEGLEETTLRPVLTNANDQPQNRTRAATDSETYVFTRDMEKGNEEQNDFDSDIESNASDSSSVSRSSTIFTIPPTTAVPSVPQHVPTFEELSQIVLEIGPRVTWEYLKLIIKNSMLVCSKSQRHNLKRMSLRRCPAQSEGRRVHEYDASQRCVSCGTQLCQHCRQSILEYGTSYDRNNIKDSGLERWETLAAMRMRWPCHDPCRNKWKSDGTFCTCSSFLVKPADEIQGQWAHCGSCMGNLLESLEKSSIEVTEVDAGAGTVEDGQKQTLAQYLCDCGKPADETMFPACRLCKKLCFIFLLNVEGPYNYHPMWPDENEGVCYHSFHKTGSVVKNIPGSI